MTPGFPFKYLLKAVSQRTRESKKTRGVCKHYGCSREARPGHLDCHTCNSRKYRLKHPERWIYRQTADSAKRRGIRFLLTFEQFKKFCEQNNLFKNRGRRFDDLTIDRIDPGKPYEVGNLRTLTWIENCSHIVENMTDPREPIARAIAKFADGNEQKFYPYLKEASKILEQVKILLRKEEETTKNPFAEGEDPF